MARSKKFDETVVVDKAIRLFTGTGYNGTSAQDLVEALGISRSSLYDTFGDKQGLFLRALRQYYQQSFGPYIDALTHTTDLPATLREQFAQLTEQATRPDPTGGCLIVNSATELAAHDPVVGAVVRESMQAVEDAFFTAFCRAQQAGLVSARHSARALARSFQTTFTGLRVMAKAGASRAAFEDVVSLALALL